MKKIHAIIMLILACNALDVLAFWGRSECKYRDRKAEIDLDKALQVVKYLQSKCGVVIGEAYPADDSKSKDSYLYGVPDVRGLNLSKSLLRLTLRFQKIGTKDVVVGYLAKYSTDARGDKDTIADYMDSWFKPIEKLVDEDAGYETYRNWAVKKEIILWVDYRRDCTVSISKGSYSNETFDDGIMTVEVRCSKGLAETLMQAHKDPSVVSIVGKQIAEDRKRRQKIQRESIDVSTNENTSMRQPFTKNDTTDLHMIKEKAESGDADAQYKLGRAFLYGTGCPKDKDQAKMWAEKSAKQGNAYGLNLLGCCTAMDKDAANPKAARMFMDAWDKGCDFAFFNLLQYGRKWCPYSRNQINFKGKTTSLGRAMILHLEDRVIERGKSEELLVLGVEFVENESVSGGLLHSRSFNNGKIDISKITQVTDPKTGKIVYGGHYSDPIYDDGPEVAERGRNMIRMAAKHGDKIAVEYMKRRFGEVIIPDDCAETGKARAIAFFRLKNYDKGVKTAIEYAKEKLSNKDEAEILYYMAYCMLHSEGGLEFDAKQGLSLMEKASEMNCPEAQIFMIDFIQNGGLKKDWLEDKFMDDGRRKEYELSAKKVWAMRYGDEKIRASQYLKTLKAASDNKCKYACTCLIVYYLNNANNRVEELQKCYDLCNELLLEKLNDYTRNWTRVMLSIVSYSLGKIYRDGSSEVPHDQAKARKFFEVAIQNDGRFKDPDNDKETSGKGKEAKAELAKMDEDSGSQLLKNNAVNAYLTSAGIETSAMMSEKKISAAIENWRGGLKSALSNSVVVADLYLGMPVDALDSAIKQIVPSATVEKSGNECFITFREHKAYIASIAEDGTISRLLVPGYVTSRYGKINESCLLTNLSVVVKGEGLGGYSKKRLFHDFAENKPKHSLYQIVVLANMGMNPNAEYGDTTIKQEKISFAHRSGVCVNFFGPINAFNNRSLADFKITERDITLDSVKLRSLNFGEVEQLINIAEGVGSISFIDWNDPLKRRLIFDGMEHGLRRAAAESVNSDRQEWLKTWVEKYGANPYSILIEKP